MSSRCYLLRMTWTIDHPSMSSILQKAHHTITFSGRFFKEGPPDNRAAERKLRRGSRAQVLEGKVEFIEP